MLPINSRYKLISDIKGMEDYREYAVDVDGNVWSLKYNKIRKLKPGWVKNKDSYLFVKLSDTKAKQKSFFVHKLVAMAFIPTESFTYMVQHINDNWQDNRMENLKWCYRKESKRKVYVRNKGYVLTEDLTEKIKKVHYASSRKGLNVPDTLGFMEMVINNALDEYINRYGLRKILMSSSYQ